MKKNAWRKHVIDLFKACRFEVGNVVEAVVNSLPGMEHCSKITVRNLGPTALNVRVEWPQMIDNQKVVHTLEPGQEHTVEVEIPVGTLSTFWRNAA